MASTLSTQTYGQSELIRIQTRRRVLYQQQAQCASTAKAISEELSQLAEKEDSILAGTRFGSVLSAAA